MSNWKIPPIPPRTFDRQFFTFLVLRENERGLFTHFQWRTEPSLHQNLTSNQKSNASLEQLMQAQNTSTLIQYFLDIGQDDLNSVAARKLAKWHLSAYLETPCYQAVRERFYAFHDFQDRQNSWETYLYIAQCLTSDLAIISQIHQNYQQRNSNPDEDSFDLNEHCKLHLINLIRDRVQQQTGRGKYSIWYSLKRASQAKLREKLEIWGIDEVQIGQYLNARDCLFEVYSKSGGRWLKPTPAQYQAATEFYQRHYGSLTASKFQQLILTCIRALVSSPFINYVGEDIERYCVNCATEIASSTPLETLEEGQLKQNLNLYLEELNTQLTGELETFKPGSSKEAMLLLRLGLQISEPSIARYLGKNQSTVSRALSRLRRRLLEAATRWAQERFQIDLTAIAQVEDYLEGWLRQRYEVRVNSVLTESFTHLVPEARELLRAKYFQGLSNSQIARQIRCPPEAVKLKLTEAKARLLADLLDWVQKTLGIALEGSRDLKRIERLVEQWLIPMNNEQ